MMEGCQNETKVYRIWGHDFLTGIECDSVHVAGSVKAAIAKHEQTVLKLGKTDDLKFWVIDHIESEE